MEGFADEGRRELLGGSDGGDDGSKEIEVEIGNILGPPVLGDAMSLLLVAWPRVGVGPCNLEINTMII